MQYRKDIDGLRSLAILPVVAYHAGFNIPGGFIGVDIFFVISGFLITSLILKDAENGAFSFLDFYYRRAKRLLPALFFMMLLTGIASLFILTPGEYKDFSISSVMATFFVSNIHFTQSIDYFSAAAETMPLLHTWSLAVEEQFYILWPVLILGLAWLLKRGKSAAVWAVLFLICVLSLAASQVMAEKSPQLAFYLTPFRLWELGAGGLLVFFIRAKGQLGPLLCNSVFALGFILAAGSLFWINQDTLFPGYNAVPVVLGTALMLWTGNMQGQRIAQIFHLSPLVYIGKISYSLYLLHWPVFALYRVYEGGNEAAAIPIALIALSFALAMISYHFIERPVRFGWSKKAVWTGSLAAALLVSGAHVSALTTNGYDARTGTEALPAYAADLDVMWDWPCNPNGVGQSLGNTCHIGVPWERAGARYVLWGDSHAEHFAPLFEQAAKGEDISILLIPGCPAFIDDKTVRRIVNGSTQYSADCATQQDKVIQWIEQDSARIDGVILAAAWSGYYRSIFEKDQKLRSRPESFRLIKNGTKSVISKIPETIPVTILSDVPRPGRKFTTCLMSDDGWIKRKTRKRDCDPLERTRLEKRHAPNNAALVDAIADRENANVYDMIGLMCGAETCPIYIGDRVFYRDDHHLRRNLTTAEKEWFVDRLKLRDILLVDAP